MGFYKVIHRASLSRKTLYIDVSVISWIFNYYGSVVICTSFTSLKGLTQYFNKFNPRSDPGIERKSTIQKINRKLDTHRRKETEKKGTYVK